MYARGPLTLPTPGPNSVIEYAHVYPRPLGGGVIIGGTRRDYDNSDTVDYALVDQIKRRACDICPELGKPEDLKIIKHNVGIRR
jgi:glycine/D-amino acid oxidase-like deaminating enzyme